jgi:hypothetical protein
MTDDKEKRNLTPIEMLHQVSGICKTNGRMNWDKTGQTPEDEFKFLANMIDSFQQIILLLVKNTPKKNYKQYLIKI